MTKNSTKFCTCEKAYKEGDMKVKNYDHIIGNYWEPANDFYYLKI